MPVPSMNPSSWEGSQGMLNQRDMAGMSMRQNQGTRSQDDANVGYLYQRSHSDVPVGGVFPHKRWAVGDDSILEQSRQISVQDLDRQFHGLTMSQAPGRPEMGHQSKKLWDDDPHKGGDGQPKGMFHHSWTPRDDTWTSGPSEPTNQIGVNMVEYVLGGSPNKMEPGALSRIKTFTQYPPHQVPQQDSNIVEEKKSKPPSPFEDGTCDDSKDALQANGMMANGLDDGGYRGSRQTSPADEERQGPVGMPMDPQKLHLRDGGDFLDNGQHPLGFGLDHHHHHHHPHYEQVGIDPLQYGGDFSSQLIPNIDSPNNYNMDYGQQEVEAAKESSKRKLVMEMDQIKNKRQRLESNISSLFKAADNLIAEAEETGQISLTQSNGLRRQTLLQRQQQPIAMLTPQQPFTLPGQQPMGTQYGVAGPNPITQGPYVLAQDPYVAAGVPFAEVGETAEICGIVDNDSLMSNTVLGQRDENLENVLQDAEVEAAEMCGTVDSDSLMSNTVLWQRDENLEKVLQYVGSQENISRCKVTDTSEPFLKDKNTLLMLKGDSSGDDAKALEKFAVWRILPNPAPSILLTDVCCNDIRDMMARVNYFAHKIIEDAFREVEFSIQEYTVSTQRNIELREWRERISRLWNDAMMSRLDDRVSEHGYDTRLSSVVSRIFVAQKDAKLNTEDKKLSFNINFKLFGKGIFSVKRSNAVYLGGNALTIPIEDNILKVKRSVQNVSGIESSVENVTVDHDPNSLLQNNSVTTEDILFEESNVQTNAIQDISLLASQVQTGVEKSILVFDISLDLKILAGEAITHIVAMKYNLQTVDKILAIESDAQSDSIEKILIGASNVLTNIGEAMISVAEINTHGIHVEDMENDLQTIDMENKIYSNATSAINIELYKLVDDITSNMVQTTKSLQILKTSSGCLSSPAFDGYVKKDMPVLKQQNSYKIEAAVSIPIDDHIKLKLTGNFAKEQELLKTYFIKNKQEDSHNGSISVVDVGCISSLGDVVPFKVLESSATDSMPFHLFQLFDANVTQVFHIAALSAEVDCIDSFNKEERRIAKSNELDAIEVATLPETDIIDSFNKDDSGIGNSCGENDSAEVATQVEIDYIDLLYKDYGCGKIVSNRKSDPTPTANAYGIDMYIEGVGDICPNSAREATSVESDCLGSVEANCELRDSVEFSTAETPFFYLNSLDTLNNNPPYTDNFSPASVLNVDSLTQGLGSEKNALQNESLVAPSSEEEPCSTCGLSVLPSFRETAANITPLGSVTLPSTLFSSSKDPFYHIGLFLDKLSKEPEEKQQKLWEFLSSVVKSGLSPYPVLPSQNLNILNDESISAVKSIPQSPSSNSDILGIDCSNQTTKNQTIVKSNANSTVKAPDIAYATGMSENVNHKIPRIARNIEKTVLQVDLDSVAYCKALCDQMPLCDPSIVRCKLLHPPVQRPLYDFSNFASNLHHTGTR